MPLYRLSHTISKDGKNAVVRKIPHRDTGPVLRRVRRLPHGLTEQKNHPNTELEALHLNDDAIEVLKSGKINNRLLCEMVTHVYQISSANFFLLYRWRFIIFGTTGIARGFRFQIK